MAALRLQLLVAMAASDGRVQPVEIDPIAATLDEPGLDVEEAERLAQLLRMLLEAPPLLADVIDRIAVYTPGRAVAEAFVRELVQLAQADDRLDKREEELLRIVCGALGLEPSSVRGGRGRPLDAAERAQLAELLAGSAAA